MNINDTFTDLPLPAIELVPQRPPMLLVDRLVARDREANSSAVEALVPVDGIFVEQGRRIMPEYFIELVAQAMAAVNGYDSLVYGAETGRGFLVGVDGFSWQGTAEPGDLLRVEMAKNFEFGPVTVMAGKVLNEAGEILASGEIKAWEEK